MVPPRESAAQRIVQLEKACRRWRGVAVVTLAGAIVLLSGLMAFAVYLRHEATRCDALAESARRREAQAQAEARAILRYFGNRPNKIDPRGDAIRPPSGQ